MIRVSDVRAMQALGNLYDKKGNLINPTKRRLSDPADTAMETPEANPTAVPGAAAASGAVPPAPAAVVGPPAVPGAAATSGGVPPVPAAAPTAPGVVTKTLKGYIVIQHNDGVGVTLRFLENAKLPTSDDVNARLSATDGYIVALEGNEFTFSKEGEPEQTFKTINLGKLPTTAELGNDVEAGDAVDPNNFFNNTNVKALFANSAHLKGKSGKIVDWDNYNFNATDTTFEIKNGDDVVMSGEFVPMTGAGRRRRKGAAALACMAVMRRRKPAPKLKPLGREVTRDGKERTVYLMGRAKVVRMRPGGCKRAVIVRVSDITKTGVRGWGPRSGW
jgi:hypothetical protein